MSGPLDLLEFEPETIARPAADTRPEPTFGEAVTATFRAQQEDQLGTSWTRRIEAYEPLVEALRERGIDTKPYYTGTGGGTGFAYDEARIWRDIARLPAETRKALGVPETRAAFDQQWQGANRARVAADEQTAARSGWAPWLIGGIGASFTDPVNLATLGVGGAVTGGVARKILTEGLANAGAELLTQPLINLERQAQGRDALTGAEMVTNVGLAFGFGAAVRGGIEAAPGIDSAAYRAAAPVRERFDQFFADRDVARAFAQQVPEAVRTPEQSAALHIVTREAEIDEASPYARTIEGDEAHRANIARAVEQMTRPTPAGFSMTRYLSRNRSAESGGSDVAAARDSSAFGRYQFVQGTWLEFYRRTFGETRESRAAILAKRADGRVQDRVMRTFTQSNVDALQRAGLPVDEGTAYLAHFLGLRDAMRVLRAGPETPVARLVEGSSIEANAAVFRGISSASELVAWARQKMGQPGHGVAARGDDGVSAWNGLELDDTLPVVRPAALDAERPLVTSGGRSIPTARFSPAEIGVDAELMQFKSGGDQLGVTDRLQGIEEWDPIAAGMVTVWEAQDGRRLIADGHQRLGLARRIEAGGAGVPEINAFVLREADGFSARDARIITALKNIGEGTGSAADAAKVLRDVGEDGQDLLRRLPPRSPLVRDGKALSRLSDEAFGAVVNEVIPESHGAAIGHLAPDPATHLSLVELLAATDPANRRQAEAIVRQALDAGFTRETQEELFGTRDIMRGLFAERAKLLDRTLSELRRLRGAFGTAAKNAEALDQAGNRIDVTASAAAAESNARALALVELLALRKGNAVNELLDQAARRVAAGEPIGRVTRDLVAGVRGLDLNELEAGRVGLDGDAAGGSGRPGEPGGQAAQDAADLTQADLDELEAEMDLGPGLFDDPATPASRAFDDEAGDGVKSAAESDWHDVRAAMDAGDPNIAARQRQEAELGAAAPMRATAEQDGEMGLALFDEADQPTFDLDDGKGPRTAADIDAELAADKAALEAIRTCMI